MRQQALCPVISGALTLASGGSFKDALVASAFSFAQAAVYTAVGAAVHIAQAVDAFSGALFKLASHAIVGGAFSVAQGGSFGTGALTGAVAVGTSLLMAESGVLGTPGDGRGGLMVVRTLIAAAAGGTASVLSSGKFANGAVTGAMAHIFNAEGLGSKLFDIGTSLMPGGALVSCMAARSCSLMDVADGLSDFIPGGKLVKYGFKAVDNIYDVVNRACSFEGNTKVRTRRGFVPIKLVRAGKDEVWARDEHTGETGYKPVSDQYANPYDARVYLTIRDAETGALQTIVSNRIHPFYVADRDSAVRLVANGGNQLVPGTNSTGTWIEAADLKLGDQLLDDDATASHIVEVRIVTEPLTAYNLHVEDAHTFFVQGADNDNASAVWVHNSCPKGVVYEVPGSATKSGDPYVGRSADWDTRQTVSSDGRDRTHAQIVDHYDPSVPGAGQVAEQRAMNARGGVGNLDNKRNEIAPKKWPQNGL